MSNIHYSFCMFAHDGFMVYKFLIFTIPQISVDAFPKNRKKPTLNHLTYLPTKTRGVCPVKVLNTRIKCD